MPVLSPLEGFGVVRGGLTLGKLAGHWDFSAVAAVGFAFQMVLLAAYGAGVVALRRRGRRWPKARLGAFVAGVASMVVALNSGVGYFDDASFTDHVAQHLIMMSLGPPLLAMGAPVTLALQSLPRGPKKRLLGLLHSPALRLAVLPGVGLSLMVVTMYAYFMTGIYAYSLTHPLFHDATHLWFVAVGCLYWWPVLSPDPLPRHLGLGAKLALLGVGIPFMSFLGIGIMNMARPISPLGTLAGTHAGGSVLWEFGDMFNVVAIVVLFRRWAKAEEREAARVGRPGAAEARRLAMRAERFGSVAQTLDSPGGSR